MFSEQDNQNTVIPENQTPTYQELPTPENRRLKKIMLIGGLALSVAAFVIAVLFIINNRQSEPVVTEPVVDNNQMGEEDQTGGSNLPITENPDDDDLSSSYTNLSDLDVEYISFTDFYQAPDHNYTTNLDNYDLPINIKIDGINYYDLARKINLDVVVADLNANGFALLDNPWQEEVNDFYSIYEKLEEKQVPFLITSDFLIYYYQNSLKKVFKDIEEHVFYDNLWIISLEMYKTAKSRYESRLASIGNINDTILEAQRMELAFFAVALELLKPTKSQVVTKGAIDDPTKFSEGDAERFYYLAPTYIKDDIANEVKLIRDAQENAKSPNLLYTRDYKEFTVPKEYKSDAKLNNFYLASRWLNSIFPLEYKGTNCADCLLDKEDWRLSMVTAGLISTDFSEREDLKNRWARIYKIMAFFKGLRDEIDYVDFRDALVASFGEDYNLESLFDDENKDAMANLDKLRLKIAANDYSEIRGAINKEDPEVKKLIGFKMLTEPYWPNDYIFSRLTHPNVGAYQGPETRPNNLTFCELNRVFARCSGFSLDIANLVVPMAGNPTFDQNTNYLNYDKASAALLDQFNRDGLWHTSNYWSTLSLMDALLKPKKEQQPAFAGSQEWREKNIKTAVSAWINFQLPWEQVSLTPSDSVRGLGGYFRYNENVYVEPNLSLINELIATNNMMAQMFTALRLQDEINLAAYSIKALDADLQMIKGIVLKELDGQALSEEDGEALNDFARKYMVDQKNDKDKILQIPFIKGRYVLKEDLTNMKLMALVHQAEGNKIISVGPVWNYRESR